MVATRKISALAILPFESEPLTSPVQAVAESGIWVTVVDHGLSVEGIEDLYVAGDNTGFGRVSGEFMVSQMPDGGNIVALRGIPTTIDNMRVECFEYVKNPASKSLAWSTATGTATTALP
jgi:ribose transport system substrate-binding protein